MIGRRDPGDSRLTTDRRPEPQAPPTQKCPMARRLPTSRPGSLKLRLTVLRGPAGRGVRPTSVMGGRHPRPRVWVDACWPDIPDQRRAEGQVMPPDRWRRARARALSSSSPTPGRGPFWDRRAGHCGQERVMSFPPAGDGEKMLYNRLPQTPRYEPSGVKGGRGMGKQRFNRDAHTTLSGDGIRKQGFRNE